MEIQTRAKILFLVWFNQILGILCENIPIRLRSHCLLNIVHSEENHFPWDQSTNLANQENWIHTFTFHDVESLQLRVTNTELEENIPFAQGFLRFSSKQRSSYCILFILYTNTFYETTSAIHNSGFGTSTTVPFLIHLRETNFKDIVSGFENLTISANISAPFHAPLIFFDNVNKQSYIYCYFCPGPHYKQAFYGDTLQNTYTLYNKLNGQGFGRSIKLDTPLSAYILPQSVCFNWTNDGKDRLKVFMKVSRSCSEVEAIFLSSLQNIINVSFVLYDEEMSLREPYTLKRFSRIAFGESYFQSIATEIVETRGFIFMSQYDLQQYSIACTTVQDLSSMDYSFLTTIKYPAWILFLIGILLYGFLSKNIFKGIDLMWPLFGIPCQLTHRRSFMVIFLLVMVLLSCSYQSCISVELMAFSEFPSLKYFVDNGYTVGFPTYLKATLMLISIQIPSSLNKAYTMSLGGKQFLEFFVANCKVQRLRQQKFPQFLDYIAKNKIMISSTLDRDLDHSLHDIMDSSVWLLEHKFLCRKFHLAKEIPLNLKASFRFWGYLSDRFSSTLLRWQEAGFIKKVISLKSISKFDSTTIAVKLDSLIAKGRPGAVNIWSAMGMAAGFLYCLGTALFLIHCLVILLPRVMRKIQETWYEIKSFCMPKRYPNKCKIFVIE